MIWIERDPFHGCFSSIVQSCSSWIVKKCHFLPVRTVIEINRSKDEQQSYLMWVKQFHKPSPSYHHKFIGGINLPFPVMGGKNDIVLPTSITIINHYYCSWLSIINHIIHQYKPWVFYQHWCFSVWCSQMEVSIVPYPMAPFFVATMAAQALIELTPCESVNSFSSMGKQDLSQSMGIG